MPQGENAIEPDQILTPESEVRRPVEALGTGKDAEEYRNDKGQFLPGFNPRSRGWKGDNPYTFHQRRNRMAILQAVTPDVAKKLTLNAIDLALNQDVRPADRLKATELLLRYGAGEPTQKHEVEVTPAKPTPAPVDLDATDVAALERIRAKLVNRNEPIEAVAKVVDKPNTPPAENQTEGG